MPGLQDLSGKRFGAMGVEEPVRPLPGKGKAAGDVSGGLSGNWLPGRDSNPRPSG